MILADTWYAEHLHTATTLESMIPQAFRPLTSRSAFFRGLAILFAGRGADAVVTTNSAPGASMCKLFYGLFGRRKLVLLEYIVHEPSRRDYARRAWFLATRRWMLARALLRAQVLTDDEALMTPSTHRMAAHRFEVVHWPSRFDDSPLPELNNDRRVVATGRRTDWQTFFAAAEGTDWEMRVVCTQSDLPFVERLATGNVLIRHDISADEHQREVNEATVYVIAVPETGASIGQIRVMNATQAGVPIVASDVSGLHGYVDDSCAVLVPPGDPVALRFAVEELLSDPTRRQILRHAARSRDGTMGDYLDRINSFVAGSLNPQ